MTSSSIGGGGGSSMSIVGKSSSSKSETVNYLLLYEAMVRHQDLEYDATYDHIALTVRRIQYLGRPHHQQQQSQQKNPPKIVSEDSASEKCCGVPKGMLTYLQMRRCLLRLGYTWNRSVFPPPPPQSVVNSSSSYSSTISDFYYDDDDVSVMSTNSASTFLSANNNSTSGGTMTTTRDIIATDAQLIMLLTTLVEMEEKDRAMKLRLKKQQHEQMKKNSGAVVDNDNDEEDMMFAQGLFLPEFVQVRWRGEGNRNVISMYTSSAPLMLCFATAAGGGFVIHSFLSPSGIQTHYWGDAIAPNLPQCTHCQQQPRGIQSLPKGMCLLGYFPRR